MKSSLVRCYLSLIGVLVFVSCSSDKALSPLGSMGEGKLATIMKDIEPWPAATTDYLELSWNNLKTAAKLVQNSSPNSVERALKEFQLSGCISNMFEMRTYKNFEDDTKLYILLKIVFDLPGNELRKTIPIVAFGGFSERGLVSGGQISEGDRVNLAWPIKWDAGHPKIVAPLFVYQGSRYDAVAEFRWLNSHFPFRKLQ